MLLMAKEGLLPLLGAGVLGVALSLCAVPRSAAGDDPNAALTSTLAVQTALQQGRDLLLRGNYQAAVHILEGQLSRINGNREYLAALRDAYRGYVKELRLANQEAAAQVYVQRLLILDPGAVLDLGPRTAASPPAAQPAKAPTKPAETPAPTVRLQKDENPFGEFHA